MSPQETIVYWTEYVIRNNGAPKLRTSGADMPLYQYFLLDIALFAIVTISLATYVTVWLMRRIYNLCLKNSKYRIPLNVDKKKIWMVRVDIWLQKGKGVILTSFWRSTVLNQILVMRHSFAKYFSELLHSDKWNNYFTFWKWNISFRNYSGFLLRLVHLHHFVYYFSTSFLCYSVTYFTSNQFYFCVTICCM